MDLIPLLGTVVLVAGISLVARIASSTRRLPPGNDREPLSTDETDKTQDRLLYRLLETFISFPGVESICGMTGLVIISVAFDQHSY